MGGKVQRERKRNQKELLNICLVQQLDQIMNVIGVG